jgi:hypothetical protein
MRRVIGLALALAVAPGVVTVSTTRGRRGAGLRLQLRRGYARQLNGDLALATGQQIHPEGYYEEATCACP